MSMFWWSIPGWDHPQSPNLDTPCPTPDLPPSQPPRTHRSPPSSRHLESFLIRVDHETMLNRRISMSTMTRHFVQLKLTVNKWYNRKKSGFAGSPRSITKPMIFVFSMVFWTVPCTVATYKHAQWTHHKKIQMDHIRKKQGFQ